MTVKLIAHSLIEHDGKFLLIKRSKVKRGKPNVFPEYWDIPGGSVEEGELPRQGAVRECMEETNQLVRLMGIIHEDSTFDAAKATVFTRLVYEGQLKAVRPVILDPEEHSDVRWIASLTDLDGEAVVPYLIDILQTKK